MFATSAVRLTSAPVARATQAARRPVRSVVLVKAVATSPDKGPNDIVNEVTELLTAKSQELKTLAQAKWEASDNKPGLVATGAGAIVVLYLVSGILNTVDHLPLLNKLFELLGLGVSGWYAYRWFAVPGEKEAITAAVNKFTNKLGL